MAKQFQILESLKKFDGYIDPNAGFSRLQSIQASQNLLKDLLELI